MEQMDQDCIRLCALVCRAWNQASARVLYQDIAITNRAAFESLVEFVRKNTRAPERLAQTTSLRVGGGRWDVPVHVVLRQIITAFSQLKSLKLGVGTVAQVTPPMAIIPATRIRLRQLVLGWGLAPSVAVPLIGWLTKSLACVNLTHLAVGRSPFNVALRVNELLAVARENIQFIHEMDSDSDGSTIFFA